MPAGTPACFFLRMVSTTAAAMPPPMTRTARTPTMIDVQDGPGESLPSALIELREPRSDQVTVFPSICALSSALVALPGKVTDMVVSMSFALEKSDAVKMYLPPLCRIVRLSSSFMLSMSTPVRVMTHWSPLGLTSTAALGWSLTFIESFRSFVQYILGDTSSISTVTVMSTVSSLWMSIWYDAVTPMSSDLRAAAGGVPARPMRTKARTPITAVKRYRRVRAEILMAVSLRHAGIAICNGRGFGFVGLPLRGGPWSPRRGGARVSNTDLRLDAGARDRVVNGPASLVGCGWGGRLDVGGGRFRPPVPVLPQYCR